AKLASVQREISPEEDKDKPVQARFATEISKKSLQRQPEAVEEEEEPIQAKSAGSMSGGFEAGDDVESQISQSKGLGSPLPDPVRNYMEPRFGVDFSGVRVHTGKDSVQMNRDIGAQAFTHGSDVYFGEGRSPNNLELTAHELTHVVQQAGGTSLQTKGLYEDAGQIQRDDNVDDGLTGEFFNLSGVEDVRANMETRFLKSAAYASLGLQTGDRVKSKLLSLSNQYESAYDNYASVITAAREEAQNQEQWINIGVGIGAGVLLGLGAAFVFPTSAAGWMAISAGEAIGAAGSAAGQAAAGAFITSRVTDALSVSGTDLEPGGLDPKILELRIWENVSEMYRSAMSLNSASTRIHMLSNAAEYLIGEIRVHVAGGLTDMNEDSVLDMMETLVNADIAMRRFDETLSSSLTNLRQLKAVVDSISLADYPPRNMEQDIWILWMSELDDPSILDLDEIEDYLHGNIGVLGSSGLLHVDFGGWTSSADERNARRAALRHASRIRGRLRMLEGRNL
ncbi:MAG TPA: DUF4157 domain-containing protein, partial [Nitrosomonas nitrosa]|nr:DUF4157 domain-containing protein [Nitrosomonas nitrosa]